ncbi:MAG: UTP--glucose-1-phosphate uridylyltransferase, partial [Clostridia bacterium]
LQQLPAGAGGEIQLTDALARRANEGRLLAVAFDGVRYDVGDKLGYVKAVVECALGQPDMGAEVARYLRDLSESGRF